MKWISVDAETPNEGEWVLYCENDKSIEIGMSLDGIFCNPDLDYLQCRSVTHWMPLPAPPDIDIGPK